MSIVVDPNVKFNIEFHYNWERNEAGDVIGMHIIRSPEQINEETQEFKGVFKSPNYFEMAALREECTIINQVNEKSILVLKEFRIKALAQFCLEWNLADGQGQPLPIDERVISAMFEQFVVEAFDLWEKRVGIAEAMS